jgi:hypothetical protein
MHSGLGVAGHDGAGLWRGMPFIIIVSLSSFPFASSFFLWREKIDLQVRILILTNQPIFAFLVASLSDEKLVAKSALVLRHVIHSKEAAQHEERMQHVLTTAMHMLVGDDKGTPST